LKEGDDKAYQEGMDKYKESIAQAKADNDLYQRKLKSIVEDAKTTYSEKDRQLRLLDMEYGKQISELDKESRDLSTRVMQMTNQALAADKSLVNATKAEITVKLQADKAFESQKQANSAEAKQDIEDFSVQRATGEPMTQILAGYGGKNLPEIRKQVAEGAIVQISEEMGISHAEAAKELAARDQAYKAGNSAETQLTKMLGSTYQAVDQLKYNVNEVKRQLKEVPSTDLAPVLNAIARKQEEWTGDPKLNSLYYNLDGAMLEAERLQSGAQASVAQLHEGAAQRAKEWLDKRWTTPAQFENLGDAMVKEGDARINSFRSAIKQMRVGGDDSATPNSSPASSGGGLPPEGSSLPSGWSVKQVK
jgi:hypothetical protein